MEPNGEEEVQGGMSSGLNPYGKVGIGAQLVNGLTGIGGPEQDPHDVNSSQGQEGTGIGGQGESGAQVGKSAVTGAAGGAVTGGMIGGPVGAVVGGGLGLLKGLFT